MPRPMTPVIIPSRQAWESHPDTLWHGTPFGEMGPGAIHVGTRIAASQALRARMLGHGDYAHPDRTYWNIGDPVPPQGFQMPWGAREWRWPGKDRGITPSQLRPTLIAVQLAPHTDVSDDIYPDTDVEDECEDFGWAQALSQSTTTAIMYRNDGEDAGSISYVVPGRDLLITYSQHLDLAADRQAL